MNYYSGQQQVGQQPQGQQHQQQQQQYMYQQYAAYQAQAQAAQHQASHYTNQERIDSVTMNIDVSERGSEQNLPLVRHEGG